MNKCQKTNCNRPNIYRSNLCIKHNKELKKEQEDNIKQEQEDNIKEERKLKKNKKMNINYV